MFKQTINTIKNFTLKNLYFRTASKSKRDPYGNFFKFIILEILGVNKSADPK
jgi:hypothetical protein